MNFSPSDIARLYGVPKTLTGKGQVLGIISLGERARKGELRGDFTRMQRKFPHIHFKDLARAPAAGATGPAIETHIDVEVANALCPEARLIVYCTANDMAALADALAAAIADDVDVVSISWGMAEADMASGDIARIEVQLDRARQAGITVCAASGDFGASGQMDPKSGAARNRADGAVSCIYPASSPLVLSCGGTTLRRLPDGSATEVVWNDTDLLGAPHTGRASGGGVSAQFDRPGWQSGIEIASADGAAGRGRILPDVAALAALVWRITDQEGRTELWGGTSAVAPFYAGLVALANQCRTEKGKSRLGYLNPRLYSLARRLSPRIFTDVFHGHNRILPDGRGYDAGPGFDACTGWGTPLAERLIAELADLP